MNIRKASHDDITTLANFNQQMALETEGLRLRDEVISAGVAGMIDNPQRGFYLVVESEGLIAASLMITYEWSDWRNGNFWWIQSVYVLPQFRRQGLYRRLYDEIRQMAADDDDVCGFRLYVEHNNRIAQQTYQSLGMHETDYLLMEELVSGLEYKQ